MASLLETGAFWGKENVKLANCVTGPKDQKYSIYFAFIVFWTSHATKQFKKVKEIVFVALIPINAALILHF